MPLGTQLTVTVDDVNKPNAKADDAHGTHVRVGNCQVNGDGSVTVQTDVERPSNNSGGGGPSGGLGGLP